MRASYLIVALGLVACGGTTSPPSNMHEQPAPGLACSDPGATVPAGDGCNTCTCMEEGWSCTLLLCAPDSCESGDKKQVDCNTCTCGEDGTWACTDIACAPTEPCTPGDEKLADDGCNTCGCTDDGEWLCTEKGCVGEPACTPGDTTYDNCNTCTCGDDGAWTCVPQICGIVPPECPAPADVPDDVACPAVIAYGRTQGGECCEYPSPCHVPEGLTAYNTAEECSAGGGPETCAVGDTKDAGDGCNTCSCIDGGTWACTLVECEEPKGCGGWLGDTCTESEYCAYEEGQLCGAADASSTCQPRPELCTQEYSPICGCDGKTYGNDCEAAAAGTGVRTAGACPNNDADGGS